MSETESHEESVLKKLGRLLHEAASRQPGMTPEQREAVHAAAAEQWEKRQKLAQEQSQKPNDEQVRQQQEEQRRQAQTKKQSKDKDWGHSH